MMMKKVFICSPYRGDVERIVALAKAHARFAARCGYCPVVPHLMYPQFLKDSDPDERILGITLGVELMKICDEVWIFGSTISNGMAEQVSTIDKSCLMEKKGAVTDMGIMAAITKALQIQIGAVERYN